MQYIPRRWFTYLPDSEDLSKLRWGANFKLKCRRSIHIYCLDYTVQKMSHYPSNNINPEVLYSLQCIFYKIYVNIIYFQGRRVG